MQLVDFLMKIPNSTGNCAFNVTHRAYITKGEFFLDAKSCIVNFGHHYTPLEGAVRCSGENFL